MRTQGSPLDFLAPQGLFWHTKHEFIHILSSADNRLLTLLSPHWPKAHFFLMMPLIEAGTEVILRPFIFSYKENLQMVPRTFKM